MDLLWFFVAVGMFAIGLFAGALAERMEARDETRPSLWHDNIYTRAVVGYHALLFGHDGQIVEAEWYNRARSAREFGGKPRDYSPGWIAWDGEAVEFPVRGLLPIPKEPGA